MEIQPDDFLYRLIIGTTPYDLPQSPIGWEENLIKFKRDTKYWGVLKEFTLPLEFVSDGATLLRSQYYQYGSEAFVRLEILQLDPKTWQHNRIFLGEIDFSKPNDTIDRFTVNVMQGGVTKLINAYDNVKYEIDLEPGITVTLPGVGISEKANSILQSATMPADWYPGVSLVINDLASGFAVAQSTAQTSVDTPGVDNWIFKTTAAIPVRIYGNIAGSINGGILKIYLLSTFGDGTPVNSGTIYRGSADTFDVAFDFNISAAINQKFYVFVENISLSNTTITGGEINISYNAATNPSTCKMISGKYLLEQILQKMNNNAPVPVTSFLLENSEWNRLYFTSGNGIRGISGSKIKTSFNDFFKSFDSLVGVGVAIQNETVILETLPSFFRDIVSIADVGEVKDMEFTSASEYLYSSLKIGYKNQKYDMVDGKDEFNTSQDWTFPITRGNKPLDKVSAYRADVRGIEEIRVNLLGKEIETKDAESDNDVFMIRLKPDLSAPEGIEAYTSVTGVNSPERMYNLELSPKKNLLRNSPLISSFLYFMDAYLIRFQSTDKNPELATTDLNGLYVKENEDISVATLTGEIFIPIIANFTAKSPKELQKLVTDNPFGAVSFTYLGNKFKGYILEVSSDVSKNKEQEYKLLLSSSNNLKNLIH